MKKVTIITFPEYESLVLDSLGAAGVTQLKEVTGPDYDEYRKEASGPDYKALFSEVEPRYRALLRLISFPIDHTTPSLDILRDYARNPEAKTKATVQQLDRLIAQLKGAKEAQFTENEKITKELDEKISRGSAIYHEKKRSLVEQQARWNIKIDASEGSRLRRRKEQPQLWGHEHRVLKASGSTLGEAARRKDQGNCNLTNQ